MNIIRDSTERKLTQTLHTVTINHHIKILLQPCTARFQASTPLTQVSPHVTVLPLLLLRSMAQDCPRVKIRDHAVNLKSRATAHLYLFRCSMLPLLYQGIRQRRDYMEYFSCSDALNAMKN